MKIVVNGEEQQMERCNVAELVDKLGLDGRRCATMVNGKVVRRTDREETELQEGDRVDLISMVGGG